MKVGVWGAGMVGSAVAAATKKCSCLVIYDKYKEHLNQNTDFIYSTDLMFVCVPTPTKDGIQDLRELLNVAFALEATSYRGVVVVKSTILPGTMRLLHARFPLLRWVHNPEFLCEKTAKEDFLNQQHVLLSGEIDTAQEVADYFMANIPQAVIWINSDFYVTEMAKYIHNCILPVKLSFLNEIYRMCKTQSQFNGAVEMATLFGNVGTHASVPGPDTKLGWGGSCFTKDTEAFSAWAKMQGFQCHTLDGAITTNRLVRNQTPKTQGEL